MNYYKVIFSKVAYVKASDEKEAYLEEKEVTSIRQIRDYDETIIDF